MIRSYSGTLKSLLIFFFPFAFLKQAMLSFFYIIFVFYFVIKFKDIIRFIDKKFLFFCLLFFLSSVIGTVIKNNDINIIFLSILNIKFLILSIVLAYLLQEQKLLKIFFFSIATCIAFVMLDSVIQYFYGADLLGYKSKVDWRLTGPFKDELIPGSYVQKFFFIFICLFLFFNNSKYKLFFCYLLIVFFIYFLYLTGERAVFFLGLLGVLFFSIFYLKKYYIFMLIPLITIAFFILVNFNNKFIFKFEETLNQLQIKDYNYKNNFFKIGDDKRFFIDGTYGAKFQLSIKMFRQDIFFGKGIRGYRKCFDDPKIYSDLDSKNKTSACNTHPHNTYLQLLVEHGLIGLFLFLIIIFTTLFKIIKFFSIEIFFFKNHFNTHKLENFLIVGCFIQLLLFIFPFIPTGGLLSNWNGTFLWIYLGLINSLKKI
jgi:O-antigen ligase